MRVSTIESEIYKKISLNRWDMNPVQTIMDNIDKRIVVSTVVGGAALGGIIFLAMRSGIKPLQTVAKAARGGK